MSSPATDDRFVAAVELIGRTGAAEFQVRYTDDEQPVVWICAAKWKDHWEAAGGMTPLQAAIRLLEAVIDGGQCAHCKRPSGVSDDFSQTMPLDALVCWYVYDPELKTFRRGCEGS